MSWDIAALFVAPVFMVIWALLSVLQTKRQIDRRHPKKDARRS
jgi:hypothetical protein